MVSSAQSRSIKVQINFLGLAVQCASETCWPSKPYFGFPKKMNASRQIHFLSALRRNQSSVLLLGLGIFGEVHSLDRLGTSGGFWTIYFLINISKVTLIVFLRFVTAFRVENGLIEFGIRFAVYFSVNRKK